MFSEKHYKYKDPMQAHLYHAWDQCNLYHQYDELPVINQWISDIYIPASNESTIPYPKNVIQQQIQDLQDNRFNEFWKGFLWGLLAIMLIASCLIITLSLIVMPILFPKLIGINSNLVLLFIIIAAVLPFIFTTGYAIKKLLTHSYTVSADTVLIKELSEYIKETDHQKHSTPEMVSLSKRN